MSNKSVKVGCSLPGCAIFVVAILFFVALIFGVTWDGTHYELGCSSEKGVSIEKTLR
jgi:hypothetical protein